MKSKFLREFLRKDFEEYNPGCAGVELHVNNSGGRWWLDESDETGLNDSGWKINVSTFLGRHLNAAFLPGADIKSALKSFREATKYAGTELGCSCCGTPFSFYRYDADGKQVETWYPEHPKHGSEYDQ